MSAGAIDWLKKNPGQAAAACFGIVGVVTGAGMAIYWLGGDDLVEATNRRTMVDAVTREVFVDMPLPSGASIPFTHPETGEPTLYQAEACYWASDGVSATLEPTWVLLNDHIGVDEPTLCPDCGRRVVGHNPLPPGELMIEAAQREAPEG